MAGVESLHPKWFRLRLRNSVKSCFYHTGVPWFEFSESVVDHSDNDGAKEYEARKHDASNFSFR